MTCFMSSLALGLRISASGFQCAACLGIKGYPKFFHRRRRQGGSDSLSRWQQQQAQLTLETLMPVQWVTEHVHPRFVMKAGELALPLLNSACCWKPCPCCAAGLLESSLCIAVGCTSDALLTASSHSFTLLQMMTPGWMQQLWWTL